MIEVAPREGCEPPPAVPLDHVTVYYLQLVFNALRINVPAVALTKVYNTLDEVALLLLLDDQYYAYIPAFGQPGGKTVCNGPLEPLVAVAVKRAYSNAVVAVRSIYEDVVKKYLQMTARETLSVAWRNPDLKTAAEKALEVVGLYWDVVETLQGANAARLVNDVGVYTYALWTALGLVETVGTAVRATRKAMTLLALAEAGKKSSSEV